MISFREQVILIIYFLIFGMFLSAMFDILHYFLRKFKVKLIINYLIQFIFWSGMVVVACLYMLKVSEGYLTIYTFCFFFLGVVIYGYLLRNDFKNNLSLFVMYLNRAFSKIKKPLIIIIFPKEVYVAAKKTLLIINKINSKLIKRFIQIFKKRKNTGGSDEENRKNSDLIINDVITNDN